VLGVEACVTGVDGRDIHQGVKVVGRAVDEGRDADLACRPCQDAFRRTVRADARSVHHPFDIARVFREVVHDRLVVLVLAQVSAGDGVLDRPQGKRKRSVRLLTEPARLVKKSRDALPAHRGHEFADELRVDPAISLQRGIAQHRDYEVDAVEHRVEVEGVGDRSPDHLEVGMGGRELRGVSREGSYLVALLQSYRDEVLPGLSRAAEDEERFLVADENSP
jgi:hypothetical protein